MICVFPTLEVKHGRNRLVIRFWMNGGHGFPMDKLPGTSSFFSSSKCIHTYIHISTYIYMCVCVCVCFGNQVDKAPIVVGFGKVRCMQPYLCNIIMTSKLRQKPLPWIIMIRVYTCVEWNKLTVHHLTCFEIKFRLSDCWIGSLTHASQVWKNQYNWMYIYIYRCL